MNREEFEEILLGGSERERNVVEQMILYLTTPIAKRKGVSFTPEECKIWAEEFEIYLGNKKNEDYED